MGIKSSTKDIRNAKKILDNNTNIKKNNNKNITKKKKEIKADELSMADKIAHFLMIMGKDFTSTVFSKSNPKFVHDLTKRIIRAEPLKKKEMLVILEEFNYIIESNQYIMDGGIEYAKNILTQAFGPSESKKILDKLLKSMGQNNYFSFLDKIKPQQLAEFIDSENPQTIAIILSHMDPTSAAEVLENLNGDKKIETAIRMANLKDVSPNIIKKISFLLEQKLDLLSSSKIEIGGTRAVAEIFNRMGSNSKPTIDMIEVFDSDLAKEIKDNMFTFDDIIRIEQDSMAVLKNNIEDKDILVKAIKNVDEELQNKFLDAMSEGERALFKEEMEYLTKIRIKEVEKAQAHIVEIAQKLIEQELIFIEMDED